MAEHSLEFLQLRNQGRRFLIRGLVFLGACLLIGQAAATWNFPFSNIIAESASVAGWVALWRPMEIFLYDLPELKRSNDQEG